MDLVGSWRLKTWRRVSSVGETTYPLGENPSGLLVYSTDGTMAVQMVAVNRPPIAASDALSGSIAERAAAYSACLAYFGTYEVQDGNVIHRIEGSLFPNWSGTVQSRPFTLDGPELVLRTPPTAGPGGTVVNEISWSRI